ncbi:MAG: DUF3307 domain-containing protein [Elusimicrobiota bacterium]|nr:DUF3307 domain-containing protein [Elusimicrobiota bacterium]
MAALARLFLAHVIADFPLQFDGIFAWKKKNYTGCLVHGIIHAVVTVSFFLGSLKSFSFWSYIILLVAVHSTQDYIKVNLWRKPEDDKISYFLIDQVLHIAFIFCALLFPFSSGTAYYGGLFPVDWLILYNDAAFMNVVSAAVLAGWGGVILLYYLDKSVYKVEIDALNRFERSYGVIERALVVIVIMKGGLYYLLVPCLFLLRLSGMKKQPLYRGILSLVFSSAIGFCVYFINAAGF